MSTRKIAILLGGVDISGGINVIFQHAIHLAEKGWKISFITNNNVKAGDIKWHPIYEYIKANNKNNIRWYTFNELDHVKFDIAIATWWRTFFNLWKVNASYYLYFVQSIESRFYPLDEIALRSIVEATYELEIGYITECNWISRYLLDIYNHHVPVVLNGIDKSLFNETGDRIVERDEEKIRVLLEGPIDIPFKNVPNTINLVSHSSIDDVWLLTPSRVEEVKGVNRVFSKIPLQCTPTVYRSCDVLIKLSYVEGMFGPPLEMFHCGGTCIVYDVTGHDEYVKHSENGIVVKTNDEEKVISYLNELKTNRSLLNRLQQNALNTAKDWPDWKTSNDIFESAIEKALQHSKVSNELIKRYAKRIWHIYEYRKS